MSDPFLDDEASVKTSRPREIFDIVQNAATTHRVASGVRDVDFGGFTYTAYPLARSEVGMSSATGDLDPVLTLPLSHPLSQRYLQQGSPPRQVSVFMRRLQENSGLAELIWDGYVTAMSIDGHLAKFSIPSRTGRSLDRNVASFLAGRLCPHVLYDAQCRVDRSSFVISTTIASHNGRRITVASLAPFAGEGDTWLPFGELYHVPTGERQTIFAQAGTVIDMQAPIPEAVNGDSVLLYAGCDHGVAMCFARYANQPNFGGQPQLPNLDLFIRGNNLGIYST